MGERSRLLHNGLIEAGYRPDVENPAASEIVRMTNQKATDDKRVLNYDNFINESDELVNPFEALSQAVVNIGGSQKIMDSNRSAKDHYETLDEQYGKIEEDSMKAFGFEKAFEQETARQDVTAGPSKDISVGMQILQERLLDVYDKNRKMSTFQQDMKDYVLSGKMDEITFEEFIGDRWEEFDELNLKNIVETGELANVASDAIPFVSAVARAKEMLDIVRASNAVRQGKATEYHKAVLKRYQDYNDLDRSFWYRRVQNLADGIAFMGEFWLSGPALRSVEQLSTKSAFRALDYLTTRQGYGALTRGLSETGLTQMVGKTTRAYAQTLTSGLPRTVAEIQRLKLPQRFVFTETERVQDSEISERLRGEAKELWDVQHSDDGLGTWRATSRGTFNMFTEYLSELAGETLVSGGAVVGNAIKRKLKKTALLKWAGKKYNLPKSKILETISKLKGAGRYTGVQGPVVETAEEYLGAIMRGERVPTQQETVEMLLDFTILQIPNQMLNAASRQINKHLNNGDAGKAKKLAKDMFDIERELTKEGADPQAVLQKAIENNKELAPIDEPLEIGDSQFTVNEEGKLEEYKESEIEISEEGKEIEQKAVQEYEQTSKPSEALFITTDGKFIDGTGKSQVSSDMLSRKQMTERVVDHREVASHATEKSGTDALIEYMNKTNNIRMSLPGGDSPLQLDLTAMPNNQQMLAIQRAFRASNGTIVADISNEKGDVVESGEFKSIGEYKLFLKKNFPAEEAPAEMQEEVGAKLFHGSPNVKQKIMDNKQIFLTTEKSVADQYAGRTGFMGEEGAGQVSEYKIRPDANIYNITAEEYSDMLYGNTDWRAEWEKKEAEMEEPSQEVVEDVNKKLYEKAKTEGYDAIKIEGFYEGTPLNDLDYDQYMIVNHEIIEQTEGAQEEAPEEAPAQSNIPGVTAEKEQTATKAAAGGVSQLSLDIAEEYAESEQDLHEAVKTYTGISEMKPGSVGDPPFTGNLQDLYEGLDPTGIRKGMRKQRTTEMIRSWEEKAQALYQFGNEYISFAPEVVNKLRSYDMMLSKHMNEYKHDIQNFSKVMKNVHDNDFRDFFILDLAMKNGNTEQINRMIFDNEFNDKTRTTIGIGKNKRTVTARDVVMRWREIRQELFNLAESVGYKMNYAQEYFPRVVRDVDAYIEWIQDQIREKKGNEAEYQYVLNALNNEKVRNKSLTDEQRAKIIDDAMRGVMRKDQNRLFPMNTSHAKAREVEYVREDSWKFYEDTATAINQYISSTLKMLHTRKFFGQLAPTDEGMQDILNSNSAPFMDNIDQTIGYVVDKIMVDRGLSPYQRKRMELALKAVFNPKGKGKIVGTGSTIAYMILLGPQTALKQIDDYTFTALETNSRYARKALWNTLRGRQKLSMEDIIPDFNIYASFFSRTGKMKKAMEGWMKYTGIRFMDNLQKTILIEANLLEAEDVAKDGTVHHSLNPELDTEEVIKRMQNIAGEAFEDLKAAIENKDYKNELVQQYAYNVVADRHPVGSLDQPVARRLAGNFATFYDLQLFTLNMFRNWRTKAIRETVDAIEEGNAKKALKAGRNAATIIAYFSMLSGAADVIRSLIYNREIDPKEIIFHGLISSVMSNPFYVTGYHSSPSDWFIQNIMPAPLSVAGQIADDIYFGRWEKLLKYPPGIGKVYDSWWGYGAKHYDTLQDQLDQLYWPHKKTPQGIESGEIEPGEIESNGMIEEGRIEQ